MHLQASSFLEHSSCVGQWMDMCVVVMHPCKLDSKRFLLDGRRAISLS